MKYFLYLILALNLYSYNLNIEVIGIDTKKGGSLMLSICPEGIDFPCEFNGIAQEKREIKSDREIFKFDLNSSTYAVNLFHDENQNGTLDKNLFGIPKEGYAISNNPNGYPTFKNSSFLLNSDKNITIKVQY